jgi:lipoate-protein ligase A
MALCLQVISKTGALLICVTNFNVTFNAIFKTTFDTIFDIIFDTIFDIIFDTIFDIIFDTIFDIIFDTIFVTNQDHRRCMASAIAWGGISFVHWVRRRLLIKVSKVIKVIKVNKVSKAIKAIKAIKANYMQPTYR